MPMTRTVKTYGNGQYIEYLPVGYNPSNSYHYVVWLGGTGQTGTDINKVEQIELPKLLKNGLELPWVVLALQMNNASGWYKNQYLASRTLLDSYTNKSSVNITGLSLGGWGTALWLEYAEAGYFKTAGIVCGKSGGSNYTKYAATEKIRCWHANNDPTGSGFTLTNVTGYVNNITAVGGNADVINMGELGHAIWDEVYAIGAHEGYLDWLDAYLATLSAPPVTDYAVSWVRNSLGVLTGTDANGTIFTVAHTVI